MDELPAGVPRSPLPAPRSPLTPHRLLATGKIKVDSYDMVGPRVQLRGDVALLTFNLISRGRTPKGEPIVVRWNSTEVYARSNGKWSIIHSHWSFIKPLPLAPPG